MSTEQQNRPDSRPSPDSVREKTPILQSLKNNTRSIRQALALVGVGAIVFGVLIWIFLRGLEGPSFILMGAGLGLLLVDAVISLATVRQALFGRRGRYGLNTAIVFVVFVTIAVIVNYTLFWAVDRPNPAGWLRIDTTATKQFLLEEQVVNTLENLTEPVLVTVFMATDTASGSAAWRDTEDMLSEFRRRSGDFELRYERIDPELNPNAATSLGVTQFPALAIEGIESRRLEIVVGSNPNAGPSVFTEQQIVTGLLVINQIRQKKIVFIAGHSERDATNAQDNAGLALAARALSRENYIVLVETLQELGTRMAIGDPLELPAAIVFAGPTLDLLQLDEQVLLNYARLGGSILFMFEPNETPDSFKQFLSRYAVAVGDGEVVDERSFVAPSRTFIQVKKSNSQLPSHPVTDGFEVLYMPGATHFAWGVDPRSVPLLDDDVTPVVRQAILASTTLYSWAETDPEIINYDGDLDPAGPLPIAVVIEAKGEIAGGFYTVEEESVSLNMIVIGDTDFATNTYFGSANNSDLFVNSVNYLAKDFELISIRAKTDSNRQLFLTKNERDFVRWSGWLLMPGLISIFGFWTWWRRR
jgi:hypothetical protein